MIGRTFSHYRIVESLGAGGMGEVYRARDQHLDRDVAVKVLPPGTFGDESVRRRFRREAEALSRLNHPHIAAVYDFDCDGAVDFLVMELVPGRTLAERLGEGPLGEKETALLAGDVAAALEEAHERGVVHRDLKPSNVIVTPKGRAKVLDFGLARLSESGSATAETVSHTGTAMAGTLPYMAPEQVRGEAVDSRADIYALGVVLFEMTTGKRPFDERHTGRLADAILHADVPPPSRWQPRLSGELERIILKCLERDPENRYQSAKEVGIDLRRLGSGPASTAIDAQDTRRSAPRRWPVAAGAAGLVILAAGGVWLMNRSSTSPGPDAIRSIVALPSRVHAEASDQFLTDAIPNTISAHLTQVRGLETKVPPSSVELARVGGDLGTLADAYGVSAFVLSSLTANADRLVLNLQLVDAGSRRLLWSRDFEGRRDNYLALAREAAEELRAMVRPGAAQVAAQTGTSNSQAELAYQQGLHHFNRYNYQHKPEDFEAALAAYSRALQIDPQMAQAAAEIGWLYEFRLESGAPVAETLPEMERWGRRAIQIDATNSRAWALLAFAEQIGPNPDPERMIVAGIRAAARGPRDAFAFNALGISVWGFASELSLAAIQEAIRIDPLYLYPPLNAAELLVYLGRADEALERVDGVLRIEPGMPLALARKALVLIDMGRARDAAALVGPLNQLVSEGRVEPVIVSMIEDGVTLGQGAPEDKRRALDRLVRVNLDAGFYNEYPPVYLWLITHGRVDDTLATLEARARASRVPYDFLRLRPEFAAVAGDPRFQRILDLSRGHFESLLAALERARGRGEFPPFLERPLADLRRKLGLRPNAAGVTPAS